MFRFIKVAKSFSLARKLITRGKETVANANEIISQANPFKLIISVVKGLIFQVKSSRALKSVKTALTSAEKVCQTEIKARIFAM